ncbi:MAG: hypothetical protein GY847_03265 [Proteobacteria bacterium]|nr:hypothetical protein [Pseudomonadota bacterium]
MRHMRNPGLKPSKEEYKRFAEDLEESPKHSVETGLKIFLGLLFLIPATVFLIAIVSGLFGALPLRTWGSGGLLAGVAVFSMLQAYRGIARREVQILPKSRIRSEAAHVGGKMSETLTGKRAVVAGWVFLVLGMVCFGAVIWVVLQSP